MKNALAAVPQGGGIVFRREGDRVSILLVTAKRDPSLWVLPKGHIEKGETDAETALRECEEEAGIAGELVGPVGEPLEFDNGREFVRVQYFLIRAVSEAPHTDGRRKQWFAFDDAVIAVKFEETRELLRTALKKLSAQGGHA
jgi:8-oxo-dGTP pyrophosphatase MutT (NUDIX family)